MPSAQDDVEAYWRALRICQGRVKASDAEIAAAYRVKFRLALNPKGKAGALARRALCKFHLLRIIPYDHHGGRRGNGDRAA